MSVKDSGLRIRIERQLREKFLAACRDRDRPAAQVLRDFMREFIASNGSRVGLAHPTAAKRTGRRRK
jgi:hypothetical protein